MEQYQDLKKEIATKDDIQKLEIKSFTKNRIGENSQPFSIYRLRWLRRKRVFEQNIIFYFTCKATAPNGRFAIGSGSCDLLEKGRKKHYP